MFDATGASTDAIQHGVGHELLKELAGKKNSNSGPRPVGVWRCTGRGLSLP